MEPLYKGQTWSKAKVVTTEGGNLYRGAHLVRKLMMQTDSTGLYREGDDFLEGGLRRRFHCTLEASIERSYIIGSVFSLVRP